jgi:hypothetical protein
LERELTDEAKGNKHYLAGSEDAMKAMTRFTPGMPLWRRPTDRLFVDIDHTAIVVWDTDASVNFYHDLLGMRVAGRVKTTERNRST